MMYSINLNKILLIFAVLVTISSCNIFDKSNPIEPCGYELFRDGHRLEVPVTFIPYQAIYQVGDTITVDMTFQDSIFCQGTRQTFKVQDYPFRPISTMYRMWKEGESFEWDSGFRVNELLIDTVAYDFVYSHHGSAADQFISSIIYDEINESYQYSYKIVLNQPGRYFTFSADYGHSAWDNDQDHDYQINSIDFDGKCQLSVLAYYTLTHDGHYADYVEELQYLNTDVITGKVQSLDPDLGVESGVTYSIENMAGFCFEGVE